MDEVMQFFWAMVDATQAALIGLNVVPVIVLSLIIGLGQGLGQSGRGLYFLKAIVAVVPAIAAAALWPQVYGMSPIWPDVTQLEPEIQIVVQLVIAWVIIRAMWSLKSAAANATTKPAKA